MNEDTMKEVTFKCSNPECEATDTLRLFPNEAVPLVINCWNCHAGLGTPREDMLAYHKGMFPITNGTKGKRGRDQSFPHPSAA